MIPTLTTEQREQLKPYERHLHTAYFAKYVTALTDKTAEALFAIYNDVFNEHMTNLRCGFCRLNVCERLGRLYYANAKPEDLKAPAKKKVTKMTPKK